MHHITALPELPSKNDKRHFTVPPEFTRTLPHMPHTEMLHLGPFQFGSQQCTVPQGVGPRNYGASTGGGGSNLSVLSCLPTKHWSIVPSPRPRPDHPVARHTAQRHGAPSLSTTGTRTGTAGAECCPCYRWGRHRRSAHGNTPPPSPSLVPVKHALGGPGRKAVGSASAPTAATSLGSMFSEAPRQIQIIPFPELLPSEDATFPRSASQTELMAAANGQNPPQEKKFRGVRPH